MYGVGVRSRQLAVLLLLTAVFSMHGAQYASAAVHDPAAASADPASDAAAVAEVDPAPSAQTTTMMALGSAAVAAAVVVGTMPDHGIPAHVWSLCLAVLLAGVALIGALVARRTGDVLVPPSSSGSRGPLLSAPPPRPPELSVLCLLRI